MRTVQVIWVTLVAFMTIFAIGLGAPIATAAGARLVVQRKDHRPLPPSAVGALEHVAGVGAVSAIRSTYASQIESGQSLRVTGVDPTTIGDVLSLDWTQGSPATMAALADGNVVASKDWATAHHKHVGSRFELFTPSRTHFVMVLRGIYEDKTHLLADLTLENHAVDLAFGVKRDTILMASVAPTANLGAVQQRAARELRNRYPDIEVLVAGGRPQSSSLLRTALYVLLAVTAVVAVLALVRRAGTARTATR